MSYENNTTRYKKTLRELMASSSVRIISTSVAPPVVIEKYPTFQPIVGQTDVKEKDLAAALTALRDKATGDPIYESVPSIGLVDQPLVSYKWSQPSQNHKPYTSAYYALLKVPSLSPYALASTLSVRTSNTRTALLRRLTEKSIGFRKQEFRIPLATLVQRAQLSHPPLEDIFDADQPCFAALNSKSSAGFPYALHPLVQGQHPKVEDATCIPVRYRRKDGKGVALSSEPIPIVEHAFAVAQRMWNLVREADGDLDKARLLFSDFFTLHPELNTYIVKRKDEVQERNEYNVKVRPFFVVPLPTRLFTTFCLKFLEAALVPFFANKECFSAYHYSPFFGGADKLVRHFYDRMGTHNFCVVSYGDDNLMAFKVQTNGEDEILFLSPDVAAMDMSTSRATMSYFIPWVLNQVQMSEVRKVGFKIALALCFVHKIHVGGPFVLSKNNMLGSGVSVTTIFNNFNSARINCIVEREYALAVRTRMSTDKPVGLPIEDFKDFWVGVCAKVKAQLGYTFKAMSTGEDFDRMLTVDVNDNGTVETVTHHQTAMLSVVRTEELVKRGIPCSFLSSKVVGRTRGATHGLLSVPTDMHKFGSSLVLPISTKGNIEALKEAERILGIWFSGAWQDPSMAEFLPPRYAVALASASATHATPSGLDPLMEADVQEISEIAQFRYLPTVDVMFDFNVLSKEAFAAKYKGQPLPTIPYQPDGAEIPTGVTAPSRRYDDGLGDVEDVYETHAIGQSGESSGRSSGKDEVVDPLISVDETVAELQSAKLTGLNPHAVPFKKAGNVKVNTKADEAAKKQRYMRRKEAERSAKHFVSVSDKKLKSWAAKWDEGDYDSYYEEAENLANSLGDDDLVALVRVSRDRISAEDWDGYIDDDPIPAEDESGDEADDYSDADAFVYGSGEGGFSDSWGD